MKVVGDLIWGFRNSVFFAALLVPACTQLAQHGPDYLKPGLSVIVKRLGMHSSLDDQVFLQPAQMLPED